MTITPEILVGFAAGALSVIFEYVPGLAPWYDKLAPEYKRLMMLGLLVAVALAVYGISCAGWVEAVTCDQLGVVQLGWMVLVAIGINQGVHRIGKKPEAGAE